MHSHSMEPSSIAFTIFFSIALLFFFPSPVYGIPSAKSAAMQNCSYSIEIETSCAPSAGTTATVGVRFGDSNGNLVLVRHLKNPKIVFDPKGDRRGGSVYGGLARCAVDMFEASGSCMSSQVCYLYVKQLGSDGWRPGWVKVHRRREDGTTSPLSPPFYFRLFVPENVWFGFNYCGPNRPLVREVIPD